MSIGMDLPLKFHMSIFFRWLGDHPKASYTSLKRCRQLGLSNSRLTYNTRPLAHFHPIHSRPSAIEIHNSICKKDFPALDGPAISILCPFLKIPLIRHGASSGRFSHTVSKDSGSGRSSFTLSIHSFHSVHDSFPIFVSTRNCFFPLRSNPGILDNLDGFLFCVSTLNPFFLHIL